MKFFSCFQRYERIILLRRKWLPERLRLFTAIHNNRPLAYGGPHVKFRGGPHLPLPRHCLHWPRSGWPWPRQIYLALVLASACLASTTTLMRAVLFFLVECSSCTFFDQCVIASWEILGFVEALLVDALHFVIMKAALFLLVKCSFCTFFRPVLNSYVGSFGFCWSLARMPVDALHFVIMKAVLFLLVDCLYCTFSDQCSVAVLKMLLRSL